MIVIVDYGMGNLRSAQKGFEKAGFEAEVTSDPKRVADAHAVVLPGVGGFADCFAGLEQQGFVEPVLNAIESGKPFLGICVGMQLLFEYGEEGRGSMGLGILPGRVRRFPEAEMNGLKVPHMGWNQVNRAAGADCPILPEGQSPFMYFVHSYFPDPADPGHVYATAKHGVEFAAVVGKDNVTATQFHPEKSQDAGIALLRAFGEFARRN